MPLHSSHSRNPSTSTSSGLLSAAGALAAFASPSLQRMSPGTTAAGTDTIDSEASNARSYESNSTSTTYLHPPTAQGGTTSSSSNSYSHSRSHSYSNSSSNNNSYSNSNMLPSNTSLPGALQPGGSSSSSSRPATSASYTAPATIPSTAPPLPSNAQHYSQAQSQSQSQPQAQQPQLSRNNTLHGHSLSSPSGMDSAQRYIPFNHTPSQTPAASNPKAYNISNAQTPTSGPAHSPLNLTDIRSRAISDANEGPQGTAFFSYADQPINSNYLAPFPTYAFDWCKWPVLGGSGAGKMAVGSYLEDPHNFIQILDTQITPQEVSGSGQAPYGLEYTKVAEATCAYPVTRILWEPPSSQKQSTDLLATSGDHLRLWSLPQQNPSNVSSNINRSATANLREPAPQKLQPLALLSNSKTPEHTAPLTSLDWNTLSPKLIITSSIDTTCTIWDIPTLTAKTQLIAHDKEVFDVRFCAGSVDVFVSCGADGSVRMFDLRSLEHSTIIYEPADKSDNKCECQAGYGMYNISDMKIAASPSSSSPSKSVPQTLAPSPPLLRLAASPHDAHLLATFASDSNIIRILDVRQPGTALLELQGHQGNLNSIEWNPSRRGMLASGGDDSLVLVWDLLNAQNQAVIPPASNNGTGANEAQGKGPFASWRCEYEVANVSWAPQSSLTTQGGDWLGVCAGRGVWGVKL